MGLRLVLFIDGSETYDSYPLPTNDQEWNVFNTTVSKPEWIYRSMYGLSKSDDPYMVTPHFEHEYKIMWVDED